MVECEMLSALGLKKPEPILTLMLNPYDLGLNPCAELLFLHLKNVIINTLPAHSIELFLTTK